MDRQDDCDTVVNIMVSSGYDEEFCVSLDWDLAFIVRLMKAGFLVMSETILDQDEEGRICRRDIVLPKLHLIRSALFFGDLHIKRSVRPLLSRYELRFDTDFDAIVHKCLETHGTDWLTPSLVRTLFALRQEAKGRNGPPEIPEFSVPEFSADPRPACFGLYRNGELKAGEFGVISGRVYTSYSGYKEENNAGTVQMILMVRALEKAGFAFLDFGMPLDYKTDLGAKNISPEEFVVLWRNAQI